MDVYFLIINLLNQEGCNPSKTLKIKIENPVTYKFYIPPRLRGKSHPKCNGAERRLG